MISGVVLQKGWWYGKLCCVRWYLFSRYLRNLGHKKVRIRVIYDRIREIRHGLLQRCQGILSTYYMQSCSQFMNQ